MCLRISMWAMVCRPFSLIGRTQDMSEVSCLKFLLEVHTNQALFRCEATSLRSLISVVNTIKELDNQLVRADCLLLVKERAVFHREAASSRFS
jgi:hypothetical protein